MRSAAGSERRVRAERAPKRRTERHRVRPCSGATAARAATRGRPPTAYVLDDAEGRTLASAAEAIGSATVAVAEYRALVARARCRGRRWGLGAVEVRTDSRLVVRHLVAERPMRNPALAALRDRARAVADGLGGVTYRWVPAAENGRADALVRELLVSDAPAGE